MIYLCTSKIFCNNFRDILILFGISRCKIPKKFCLQRAISCSSPPTTLGNPAHSSYKPPQSATSSFCGWIRLSTFVDSWWHCVNLHWLLPAYVDFCWFESNSVNSGDMNRFCSTYVNICRKILISEWFLSIYANFCQFLSIFIVNLFQVVSMSVQVADWGGGRFYG